MTIPNGLENMTFEIFLAVTILVAKVAGHGYLMDPPARNSMWRAGFDSEENYNDGELNCGGFSNQWDTHDGKCGTCGDPYQGPRRHEAGGVFAAEDRPITRCYNKDDDAIDIHVVITSHHKGYFEFRLCEHNSIGTAVDQSCFDNGILLTVRDSDLTRYDINENKQTDYFFQLDMPSGVTCTQCVIQWKYNAGNNWGCDDTGCGMGLGRQEQFINCADIAILGDCAGGPVSTTEGTTETSSTARPYSSTSVSTSTGTSSTVSTTASTGTTKSQFRCSGVGNWNAAFLMELWCMQKCCPNDPTCCSQDMCQCTGGQ